MGRSFNKPIERMIDAACGLEPKQRRRLTVIMECPVCGRTKEARIDKSDPPNTAKVRAVCNECPDDAAMVDYFDEAGRQIDLNGTPMRHP